MEIDEMIEDFNEWCEQYEREEARKDEAETNCMAAKSHHVVGIGESGQIVLDEQTNQPKDKTTQPAQEVVYCDQDGYALSLREMMKKVSTEPALKMIYPGIKEHSMGIIFGTSKSGKTMYSENFGMSIAAGATSYLGAPIDIENRKVLFISLEEHAVHRTGRNKLQADRLIAQYGSEWLDNYIVVSEKLPRYIATNDDWAILRDLVNNVDPGLTIIDSLTHLYSGSIEESATAKILMQNLRELTEATSTTILGIHHTTKLYDRPLSIDAIAGSRILMQELDFMFGINRTSNNIHYIKDVALRYAQCRDLAKTFNIENDCWLNITGEMEESTILSSVDGRTRDENKKSIYQYFLTQAKEGIEVCSANAVFERFAMEMSKPTFYSNLEKLINEKKIIKFQHGEYKLAA
jgi:hypothetical protein